MSTQEKEVAVVVVDHITLRAVEQNPGRVQSKARMYFHHSGESILENMENRRSRPVIQYKQLFPKIASALELELGKPRWSQHAGCTACPCSPGFILDELRFFPCDIHVHIKSVMLPWEKEHTAPVVMATPDLSGSFGDLESVVLWVRHHREARQAEKLRQRSSGISPETILIPLE